MAFLVKKKTLIIYLSFWVIEGFHLFMKYDSIVNLGYIYLLDEEDWRTMNDDNVLEERVEPTQINGPQ